LAALVLASATSLAVADEHLEGKRVYQERCVACHGEKGNGDGPIAWAIEPRPRNFADAAFWKERTTAQLRAVVQKGKPGTQMGAFEGVLSDAEIDAVVAFIETFRPAAGSTRARQRDGQVARAEDDRRSLTGHIGAEPACRPGDPGLGSRLRAGVVRPSRRMG